MKPAALFAMVMALVSCASGVVGQQLDPVKWSLIVDPLSAPPGGRVAGRLRAIIDPGWHLYSPTTPPGGPIPTRIELLPNAAVSKYRLYQPKPVTDFDQNFKLNTETFDKTVTFLFDIELSKMASGRLEITALARYQACDARQCLLPVRKTATATITVDPAAPVVSIPLPPGYTLVQPVSHAQLPQSFPPKDANTTASQGLGAFLLLAFGFGLAAIFTPCVFPMIPVTVSFFLTRQAGSRGAAVIQAATFCLGIVVLFSSLGLAVTAILGPFGVIQLGSSPWVNGFIALVLFFFSLSLLGAFELVIPSGVLTWLNRASERRGVLGTLIMGLTFSLTAFACVGPFVGSVLAGSIQVGGIRPLAGMVCFSMGMAFPFFFLALFPSYLRKLPKSGSWMVRVEIVLGFVLLAAALKYVSNVDAVLHWNWLTRERFLAGWAVVFALPGLYLLGLLHLEGVEAGEKVGIGRLLVGAAFLAFALSLLPGMFGASLGELDAYVPPVTVRSSMRGAPAQPWIKDQYQQALEEARAEGKLVLVSFTGYACTNCHWMKANMLSRPDIRAELDDRFILVELYTDGKDEASEFNQKLLQTKFGTSAIPYYAIIDADGNVQASFAGLTRNPKVFLEFLQRGVNARISAMVPGST